jgi:hypothetical protein
LGAYNQTAAGGEIAVLGSAGYGALTITHAISIVNPGGFEAGITVPVSGNGIQIDAGTNDPVFLRGLTIDGAGVGTTGIQFNSGASLVVENCVIRHLTNDALNVYNTSGTVQLLVSNSLIADNGTYGIFVFPRTGSAGVTANFNHVEASNNFAGNIVLEADKTTGTVSGTAFNSVSVGGDRGFNVYGTATLNVFHSVASYNGVGLYAQLGGIIRIDQSMVTGNNFGWLTDGQPGSTVLSYGNNSIDGNALNQSAPPMVGLK